MSNEEQAGRAAGSVPHAFRNALFWRWVPEMPAKLPPAFVTVLYACASGADAAGRVRFRDGKPIRIRDLAAAGKCDEKDARRYLDAAIAAGVLAVEGERRRGTPTLYALVLSPAPDWGAAVASLAGSRRERKDREDDKVPPWLRKNRGAATASEDQSEDQADEEPGAENGGLPPEPGESENEEKFGGQPPEPEDQGGDEVRGAAPRTGSGGCPPFGSGGCPPNNPGDSHEVSHEMADESAPPEPPPRETGHNNTSSPTRGKDDDGCAAPSGVRHCTACHGRLIYDPRRPDRTIHRHCDPNAQQVRQPPLMAGVPAPPEPPPPSPSEALTA